MMRLCVVVVVLFAFVAPAVAAPHWESDLVWTPPATGTATGYEIQRRLGLTGTWDTLTTVGAGVPTYRDVGPYQDGQVVCWRVMVQPQNPDGSAVGKETCLGMPIQYPGPVDAPQVTPRYIPN